MIIQFCGLSGAGKSTLAKSVKKELALYRLSVEVIDGDEYRKTLSNGLGFSKPDRLENIRRMAFVARQLSKYGIIAIICAINPYDEMRAEISETYPNVKLVHIDCSLSLLRSRDTKGLYKRALLPESHPEKVNNLSGINDPFDIPVDPDLYINTGEYSISQCTNMIVDFIRKSFVYPIGDMQPDMFMPGLDQTVRSK